MLNKLERNAVIFAPELRALSFVALRSLRILRAARGFAGAASPRRREKGKVLLTAIVSFLRPFLGILNLLKEREESSL